MTIGFTKSHDV